MNTASRPISIEQQEHIFHEISLNFGGKKVKKILQEICGHYEKGRSLLNQHQIRPFIHSYLSDKDVLLRRWSIKALGLIGNQNDFHRLIERFTVEDDMEAQTWCIAALVNISQRKSVSQIIKGTNRDYHKSFELAGRLYGGQKWLSNCASHVTVALEDDPVTLKWAAFLIGYNKTDQHLFDPRHEDKIFMRELNLHDVAEISEYSIWATWQRSDFNLTDIIISSDDFLDRPENVRKWLYRVGMQSADSVCLDPDVITDWRRDDNDSAREGLADGVGELIDERYDAVLQHWLQSEQVEAVKHALLSGLSKRQRNSPYLVELLRHAYKEEALDSPLRRRLAAASAGLPMSIEFGQIRVQEEVRQRELSAQSQTNLLFLQLAGNTMTSFNAGNNINAQTIAGGDMINSANASVQNLLSQSGPDAETLGKLLEAVKSSNITEGQKGEIAAAVKDAADDPTPEKKKGILSKMRSIRESIEDTGGAIDAINKLIGLAVPLLSGGTSL